MIKHLSRHGNSYALVIEEPILELLRVTAETPFEIMSDGQCLVLTPVRNNKEEKKFQESLETIHPRFGLAMKRLAESAIAEYFRARAHPAPPDEA